MEEARGEGGLYEAGAGWGGVGCWEGGGWGEGGLVFWEDGDRGAEVGVEGLGDEEAGEVGYAGDEAGWVEEFGGGDSVFAPNDGVDLGVFC